MERAAQPAARDGDADEHDPDDAILPAERTGLLPEPALQRLASTGLTVVRFSNLKEYGQGDPVLLDRAERQHPDPALSKADLFSWSSRAMASGG